MAWHIGENKYPQLAKVWEVVDHNTYAVVKLGTSRKDKKSGNYLNSSWSFCRFVGENAYPSILEVPEKATIVILAGTISQEPYMKDNVKTWPKSPQITVFAWENFEPLEKSKSDEPPQVEEESSEDELPF